MASPRSPPAGPEEWLPALATYPYVAARYPDVGGPKITRFRAEAYLDAARRIVRWVRRQMA